MAQTQIVSRIDSRLRQALKRACKREGLVETRFVEDAIIEKLETLEDLREFERRKKEPRVSGKRVFQRLASLK